VATVMLVVHPGRKDAEDLAESLTAWLSAAGHRVVGVEEHDAPVRADLAVSLGGDGTMLRTVDACLPTNTPVLGVNLGTLGYLTEVEPEHAEAALESYFAGRAQVEERMALEALVVPGPGGDARRTAGLALNEVVVERAGPGHTIRTRVVLSGVPFIVYAADGVIVATPTGSTAYNLSARGPILSPQLEAMVLTPVSPHMLFDRALVLGAGEQVRLEVMPPHPAALCLDGARRSELLPGDAVVCRPAAARARLVRLRRSDFHAIVRAKFGLEER